MKYAKRRALSPTDRRGTGMIQSVATQVLEVIEVTTDWFELAL
jgi:hypothetical protein